MSSALQTADFVLYGRVATLAGDAGFGWQPGLAIANGAVIALGDKAELAPLVGPRTREWRLDDAYVAMPGITDAHLHLMNLVLGERQLDLTGADLQACLDAIAARHREMSAAGDADGWLLGHGWSLHALGAWPDAGMLERAAPGRPIALYAHDHHARWVSRAAMARAGIGDASPDPAGGLIRRDQTGAAAGILHEVASTLVDHAIPDPTFDELEQGLGRVAAALAREGVTGCHDPGELTADGDITRGPVFYRTEAERGRLPLRVHASVRAPQLDRAIELGLVSGQRAGMFRMGWLKLFADGSLGSRSAHMLEPYEDADSNPPTGGPLGMSLTDPEELDHLLRRASAAGIVGQVHAIGDAAVREVLDVYAGLPRSAAEVATGFGRRVEHAQLVHPADIPRFGQLGVAASIQPVHLRSDDAPARVAWGARVDNLFPLGGLAAAGALIPLGTDAPVEPTDPWPGIAVAIARREPTDPRAKPTGRVHAIDLARAIRAACLDPALVAGETNTGRLSPGYRADLLVLPARILDPSVDPAELAAARPVATVIDGEVIHAAADFGL